MSPECGKSDCHNTFVVFFCDMVFLKTWCVVIFVVNFLESSSPKDVSFLDILDVLGWDKVTLVSTDPMSRAPLVKRASSLGIYLSVLGRDDFKDVSNSAQLTYLVFDSAGDFFPEVKDILLQYRYVYTVMVINPRSREAQLDSLIRTLGIASGFFKVTTDALDLQSNATLSRIQTFSREESYVEDIWKVKLTNGGIKYYLPSYDMQGHLVTTVALSWAPWLDMSCPDELEIVNCSSNGVLTDIMNTLASTYNFSWTVDRQVDQIWGSQAVNTSDGLQRDDFVGVLGDVINRRYDICLSVWMLISERTEFVDYTIAVADVPRIIIIDGEKAALDLTLFVRPFTTYSWLAILGFLGVACLLLAALPPLWHLLMDEETYSGRIVTLSAWSFFILISAYYGGALTMFFSSSPSQPFRDVRDGLTKHPPWELVLQKGTGAHITNRASDGDPPYVAWQQRQEEFGDLLLPSMKVTLEKLTEGQYFTDVELPNVANFLHNNYIPGLTVAQVGQTWTMPGMLIVSKHSPLTVMLNQGLQRLRQSGTFTLLMERHLLRLPGSESSQGSMSVDTTILGMDHMGAIFLTGLFSAGSIFTIFVLEISVSQVLKNTSGWGSIIARRLTGYWSGRNR